MTAQAQRASQEAARSFDIAPQSVVDALADFGRQSGLQVSMDADQVRGLSTQGVHGTMTPSQALDRLLASTGLTARIEGKIVSLRRTSAAEVNPPGTDPIFLGSLRVEGAGFDAVRSPEGGAERDARREDAIYDRDISSTFAGKEEVERYKGVTPSDVLTGMVNVFSGDARNSGAIDPSIRGVQGPGRAPVIIDGTEQALTVWRGYNGASNRSYIDPSLIAGVEVLKGPVSERGVRASTSGAVVINTLDADDILKPGRNFGLELRLEGGNNSTDPRLPTLLTGQDYRTIPGWLGPGSSPSLPYRDTSLLVNVRNSGDNEFLSFGDRAVRLAAAGRVGDVDLFGAYAYRERGNYFAGKHDAGYYAQDDLAQRDVTTFIRQLALNYEPGDEVPNTSSELESWLFKGTWHIVDDQYLQLGFRDSKSRYGEIMPSRIRTSSGFGDIQWPLSSVHAQAYNAEYKWQPESPWIDIKASVWGTRTVSDTYSAGGFPNMASAARPIIVNSAIANARNNRFGFTASNQFRLSSKLDLLLEGSWQHEKLRTDDEYEPPVISGWRMLPRAGRREEYRINLRGEWRPVSFLKFNAGLTYSGYWAKDDFLPELIERNNGSILSVVTTGYRTSYQGQGYGYDAYLAYRLAEGQRNCQGCDPEFIRQEATFAAQQYAQNPYTFTGEFGGPDWMPNANGRYRREDNICLNGTAASMPGYIGNCRTSLIQDFVNTTQAEKKSAHGWTPSASATAYLSSASRIYVRYAQALRFPSLFESTVGFSASIDPFSRLKPERMKSWEAAWIQDLRALFGLVGEGQHADVKLSWYHNTAHNVIERDTRLLFSNVDRQIISGFELQARYDNGRLFAELGAGHMTTNKVCDESRAATADPVLGRVPNCVKYGFVSSYLLTQATPETSVNLTGGARLLDQRLELGGRMTWYSAYDNPQLDQFIGNPRPVDNVAGYALNVPYTWGEILTFDAYVKFRLNDRFSAELVGTNLTDRYFVDPLTRTLNPAPGRAVRLSLTGRL